jgi:thiol-disulfide isomerase/thioredoxin
VNGRPTTSRAAGVTGLLIAAVLLASAAAGFLVHRFLAPARPTLYAVPATRAPQTDSSATAEAASHRPSAPPARPTPSQLPDIALPGPDGVTHRLADWRGRPVLVNFWATWCDPCRREIPLLKALRHEHAAEGLQVVGIAVDSQEAVRQYTASYGIDYPVLVGEQGGLAAVSAFGMDTVLPFSVFADRSGRILALKVGELHRDEAELILERLREVDAGTLALSAAREQISAGVRKLNAARLASGG